MRAPRIQLHSHLQSQRSPPASNTPMPIEPCETPISTVQPIDFMPRPVRTGGGDAPADEALTPIAGVTIERYAAIVRGIASYNYDQSMLPGIAADQGVPIDTWRQVHEGWNARIKTRRRRGPPLQRHLPRHALNDRSRRDVYWRPCQVITSASSLRPLTPSFM